MASRITKSNTINDEEITSRIELSSELITTLSFIESGCLPALFDDKTAFIIKAPQEEIDSLLDIEKILFSIECIKRPEFPSVRMYFVLRDIKNTPHRFDYFFSIESGEDMGLLERLKDQDHLDMIFFSTKIEYLKKVEICETDKEKINKVIDEARS